MTVISRLRTGTTIILLGLMELAGASANESDLNLINEWRSGHIALDQAMFSRRVKMRLTENFEVQFSMDELQTTHWGTGGYSVSFEGTYEVPSPGKIDLLVATRGLTPMSANTADSFNQDKMCGQTDWTAGKRKDIKPELCAINLGELKHDIIKDIYEIDPELSFLFLGMNLARNYYLGGADVQRDAEGRPLSISRNVALAPMGVIPPNYSPPPIVDMLSGLYEVTKHQKLKGSCDISQIGPHPNSKVRYIYFYPLSTFIPLAPGWMSKECEKQSGCAQSGGFNFSGRWNVAFSNEQSTSWWGDFDVMQTWGSQCRGERTRVTIVRVSESEYRAESRRHEFMVPALPGSHPGEWCPPSHPNFVELFEKAPCIEIEQVNLKPIDYEE